MNRYFVPALRALTAFVLSTVIATAASAQDRPNTILVLDGSGSMWGQIDGVAKITIAQEVVTTLLDTLPESESVGLMSYGHRARGDCTDIETLVAPGPGTRDAIAAAVAAIKPLGKTPMTDAVIAAAEALRYTEDSATVILISDGVETCNPDPCAAARLLEEAGIDFTAHVIGFDVSGDAEALGQMQCIAAETGGQFLMAANAAELTTALASVVEEPEPPLVSVSFTAVLGDDKVLIETPVLWDIGLSGVADPMVDDASDNPLVAELAEGAYVATAYSVAHETVIEATFVAITGGSNMVEVVFPEIKPTASLIAPDSAPRGSTIQVGWNGPDERGDNIQIGRPGETYLDYTNTRDGNPIDLILPIEPGIYELRYLLNDREIIGTRPIEVLDAEISVTGPESATIGSVIEVDWVGPAQRSDNIQIGLPGETYSSYTYTRDGNPVSLQLPAEPGMYELRYVFRDREIAATSMIEVTPVEVGLIAPAEAAAGSEIQVGWTWPNAQRDNVQIAEMGGSYISYAYLRDGNPVTLQMPATPGEYELRYVFQDRETIYTQPITVTKVDVGFDAPDAAVAGSMVDIGWTGPNAPRDNVQVAEIGGSYINYAYLRDGNPVKLQMPPTPGNYELRYVFQDRETIYTQPISVTPVSARLVAPPSAAAGSDVPVGWDGPANDRDFIAIAAKGESGYITYSYVNRGNPVMVQAPDTPGSYEVRYVMSQDNTVIASIPLVVTAP